MLSTLELLHHLRYPHGSLPYFLQVSFQTPTHQENLTQHPVKEQSPSHLNQAFLSFLKSIYFWLCWVFVATLGLSLVTVSEGFFLLVMHGLLIAVASLVEKHGL